MSQKPDFITRIPRELAIHYGKQAFRIAQAGAYRAPSGENVHIAEMIGRSVKGTVSYPPDIALPEAQRGTNQTKIEVHNTSTLSAVEYLSSIGQNPVALNFASATHPGGGFLEGARAQEEYLTRSSALYMCLKENPMYEYHQSHWDPLYTNYAIYSPDVPIFRADGGSLLENPYTVGIITSPAVYAKKLDPSRHAEIEPAMWQRILKVLAVGIRHDHDAIVLGAWGCGAFGNDPVKIARLFRKALSENFNGAYQHVIFAILDWSSESKFIGPFQEEFGTPQD